MNCKVCKEPGIVRISKSQKNLGKEFYACPTGCQGWIGWVDEAMNKPLVKVFKPPATPMPNTVKDKHYINDEGEVGCKACGKTCMIKRSSSEKNINREYFACQDGCNIWNGWVDEYETNTSPETTISTTTISSEASTTFETDDNSKSVKMAVSKDLSKSGAKRSAPSRTKNTKVSKPAVSAPLKKEPNQPSSLKKEQKPLVKKVFNMLPEEF